MKLKVDFKVDKQEFSTKEVSEITWISIITIRKYIHSNLIKWHRKWPRNWVVNKKDLNTFLEWIWREAIQEVEIERK